MKYYNDEGFLRAVSQKMGGVPKEMQTAMATIHDNIRAGDLAAVQKHLSYGVSPDTKDAAGISALHFAVGVALSCITNLFSIFHTIQTFCIVLHVGCFILDAFPFDWERADPAESSCSFVEKFLLGGKAELWSHSSAVNRLDILKALMDAKADPKVYPSPEWSHAMLFVFLSLGG